MGTAPPSIRAIQQKYRTRQAATYQWRSDLRNRLAIHILIQQRPDKLVNHLGNRRLGALGKVAFNGIFAKHSLAN